MILSFIRALSDITFGPEVRQIFKIRTVRKPNDFLPGRWTVRNRKKSKENFQNFSKIFFQIFLLFIYLLKCLKTQVRIQSSQIWVSSPVRSENSYAQSGRALYYIYLKRKLSGS